VPKWEYPFAAQYEPQMVLVILRDAVDAAERERKDRPLFRFGGSWMQERYVTVIFLVDWVGAVEFG
jgi:hypothetical protein